jgi:hypothetical protein
MKNKQPLRVYFGSASGVDDFDPALIHVQTQWAMIEALYSPLVEVDANGQVVGGWAHSFDWDGLTAVFQMRDDARASDGLPITAADAAFSLKRLLVLASNTHGDLSSILCTEHKLSKISDPCSDIVVDGNTLRIKLKRKHYFLFSMLASMDYAIVPERAVDPQTLKIKNYMITSGPYSVQHVEEGKISLTVNKNHWHFSEKIAENIDFIGLKDSAGQWLPRAEITTAFEQGKIDFIPTYAFADPGKMVELAEANSDVKLHMTQPIGLSLLRFNPHSTRMTPELKVKIGAIVRRAFAKRFAGNKFGRKPTNEFFSPVGDGGLDAEQKKNVAQIFEQYESLEFVDAQGLILQVSRQSSKPFIQSIGDSLPGLKVIEASISLNFRPIDGIIPDMMINVTDTAGIEDISLLGYSLASGIFPYLDEENKAWLQNYIGIESKEERLKLLRKLHFDMLTKPTIVPLSSMPYHALTRAPWQSHFSELFAGSPLWQITKKD